MSETTSKLCVVCGLPWPGHKTDLQFELPDEVLNRLDEVVDPNAWMSGRTPSDSDLLRLPPFGAYIRALLPVRVEGGGVLTYGPWVKVDSARFDNLRTVWSTPDYAAIRVEGALANKLPFQHATYADVVVEVVDPNRKLVITSSADTWTQELLDTELPHSFVE
jgi:hypothetical protein